MLVHTGKLLAAARAHGFAIGAFNIYNLEGATAVIRGAEEMCSPVILQLLPSALELGGSPLIAMCLDLAKTSSIPAAVHLDHCSEQERINFALQAGLNSIMADGSALSYLENLHFTRMVVQLAGAVNGSVEGELGKLSGQEDGISIAAREEMMTSPEQAAEFVEFTGISALAVCIGNVHGTYRRPPELDFERLAAIAGRVTVPLVLHGTSGLPDETIARAMRHGVCKFNVNTEIRTACVDALAKSFACSLQPELMPLMRSAITAMKDVVQAKIKLFCSDDKASLCHNTLCE
jgi:tagatose 1,6-diphosphate aldolase GatY/KbaY